MGPALLLVMLPISSHSRLPVPSVFRNWPLLPPVIGTLATAPHDTLDVVPKSITPFAVILVVVMSPFARITVVCRSVPTDIPAIELKGFMAIKNL